VFIAGYFSYPSLSPRRGDDGAIFMVSTHSRASTLQWAMIEESPKDFLMASRGKESFDHLSLRRHSTGAPLAPTTTVTWKENAPTFPPLMVVPQSETI
jgi:hypothetical protein